MTITKVIKQLAAILEEHGNLPVNVESDFEGLYIVKEIIAQKDYVPSSQAINPRTFTNVVIKW